MEWSQKYYIDKISKPLIRVLVKLKVTPNQVTIFNHVMTLTLGIWGFSRGTWTGNLIALAIMVFNGVLDYADGDLARETSSGSNLGSWLDSAFDVIIQNAVMASIAVGCHKNGMPFYISAWFFVGNAASNLVSFHYNAKFGFSSHGGNCTFRTLMSGKLPTSDKLLNKIFKNIIDPTASRTGLFLFTVRYWLTLGALLNCMGLCFIAITIIGNIRWFIMYVLYALHLDENKKLWVNQVLATLDSDREEYYKVRGKDAV